MPENAATKMLTNLGGRVRRRRMELGMTQSQLADAIGCHQPDVSEIEWGKGQPRLVLLHDLACALGVPPGYFLDDPPSLDRTL